MKTALGIFIFLASILVGFYAIVYLGNLYSYILELLGANFKYVIFLPNMSTGLTKDLLARFGSGMMGTFFLIALTFLGYGIKEVGENIGLLYNKTLVKKHIRKWYDAMNYFYKGLSKLKNIYLLFTKKKVVKDFVRSLYPGQVIDLRGSATSYFCGIVNDKEILVYNHYVEKGKHELGELILDHKQIAQKIRIGETEGMIHQFFHRMPLTNDELYKCAKKDADNKRKNTETQTLLECVEQVFNQNQILHDINVQKENEWKEIESRSTT